MKTLMAQALAIAVLLGSGVAQKTIVVGVEGGIDTFDPAFSVGSRPTQTLAANVFETLIRPNIVTRTAGGQSYQTVDMTRLVGQLAESWQFDPQNPNRVIFKIRKGVKYHNGEPFTADDVIAGYKRIFGTQSPTSFLVLMGGAVKGPENFEKVDDYTVALTMSQGNNLTLRNLTIYNLAAVSGNELKAKATAQDPWALDYFKKNLGAGTGPYQLESYVPGDQIVLKANPNYYLGKPKVERVILKIIPDAAQRVLLLKTGAIDMADRIPVSDLDGLKANPNLQVLSVPSTRQDRLLMNYTKAPFNNALFRRALAYAIPYERIVQEVYKGHARVAAGPIENGMPTSDRTAWPYRYSLQQAKNLLTRAGYPEGKGVPELTLTIRIGNVEWEKQAVIIQDALQAVGIKVNINKLALAAFNEQQQGKKLDFFIDDWISWTNDPYYHLFWNFYSKSPTNYGQYANPEVDKIIEQNLISPDEKTRAAASRAAQKLIGQDVPQIYLTSRDWVQVMSKNLSGYIYFNDELTRFYYMDKK